MKCLIATSSSIHQYMFYNHTVGSSNDEPRIDRTSVKSLVGTFRFIARFIKAHIAANFASELDVADLSQRDEFHRRGLFLRRVDTLKISIHERLIIIISV